MTIEIKIIAEIEAGKGLEKDHFLETLIAGEMIGVQVIVGPDQGQEQVKERERSGRDKRKISMVRPRNERKYITDREILEKYIDLDKSCLMNKRKEEVMEMLFKYKGAFTLRDDIGTCPT